MSPVSVVRGTNQKPVASEALASFFADFHGLDGQLFIGYPIVGSADGRYPIDAVLLSPRVGIVVFDLVESVGRLAGYPDRQDDAATKLTSKLLAFKDLVHKRVLQVPVEAVSFLPGAPLRVLSEDDYRVANAATLASVLAELSWETPSEPLFDRALSAIQSISTIRRSRTSRSLTRADSRGAKLQRLEESIATLDNLQSKAVIETVEGVQRIRGLAGSGKTIVLALKAAYLHAQHPDWHIAVTFNTRSLKDHFTRLINNFSVEQTGEEPDWEVLRVLNAWGAPGGPERDGVYFQFCQANNIEYLDFRSASSRYGRTRAFDDACAAAIAATNSPKKLYDAVLIDEAQDLPADFLRLCYESLEEPRRLVYAYDELQNLSGTGVSPAEEIFGRREDGTPRVVFGQGSPTTARRDIILEKCYRNSRPLLVSAHGLGFGIYRDHSPVDKSGLVQMFDQPQLWEEIGYRVKSGQLSPGSKVVVVRTSDTSPEFLEQHSPIEDLIQFLVFESEREQAEWVADTVETNLAEDELTYEDIVIINTNPVTTRQKVGPVRKELHGRGIMTHLAGVDTSADVFFRRGHESITCTGVYRAKGNEAGMVYVLNAQESHATHANLATVRNRLFTAMTRSKAWVRVLGIGDAMNALAAEYESLRKARFELRFRYPTAAELKQLQIVHRDMSQAEIKRLEGRRQSLTELVADLEAGNIYAEDLDDEMLQRLRSLLRSED